MRLQLKELYLLQTARQRGSGLEIVFSSEKVPEEGFDISETEGQFCFRLPSLFHSMLSTLSWKALCWMTLLGWLVSSQTALV